jgi:lysophospholipase L1-like esterase
MKRLWGALGLVVVIISVGMAIFVVRQSASNDQAITAQGDYVALGDSVAAGVGLMPDSDSSACDRTNAAYPYAVSFSQHFRLHNFACSGATIASGVAGPQEVNKLSVASQIEQLYGIAHPKLITLTIGANDTGWLQILTNCYRSVCGSPAERTAFTAQLSSVEANIVTTLATIKQHYPSTLTVLTGYYQLFPQTTATCADLTGIDSDEQAWAREMQTSINQMLLEAATQANARFSQADFSGHELCSDDSWVQSITDKRAYHPTEAGQRAIAKSIENTLIREAP